MSILVSKQSPYRRDAPSKCIAHFAQIITYKYALFLHSFYGAQFNLHGPIFHRHTKFRKWRSHVVQPNVYIIRLRSR